MCHCSHDDDHLLSDVIFRSRDTMDRLIISAILSCMIDSRRDKYSSTIKVINRNIFDELRRAEDNVKDVYYHLRLDKEEKKSSEQLYLFCVIFKKAGDVRSAELVTNWLISSEIDVTYSTSLRRFLLNPYFKLNDSSINFRQWQKNTNGYITRTDERISSEIKKSFDVIQITSHNIEKYLQQSLYSSEILDDEIDQYYESRRK